MTEIMTSIKYGTSDAQTRYVPIAGGIKAQSRRVDRDQFGNIELVTEWEDLGCELRWTEPDERLSWFDRLLNKIF